MKITSINTMPLKFGASQDVSFDSSKPKKEKKHKYKDPLQNYPMRLLGYTNDVGVAINELFPTVATMCWVPALMYFGADIYDKYKNKGDKYDPNSERALKQAVFQANASIVMPMVFGHLGMSAFSQLDKLTGNKLSTNAKEQTYRFIKTHAESQRIFDPDQNMTEVFEKFDRNFANSYNHSVRTYKNKNIFAKFYDKTLANCKYGAVANSNERNIKDFARMQFKELVETSKDMDAMIKSIDQRIFKLKAWKSAGAFTALFLTMKFIDSFTENVLIKKIIEPQIKMLGANSRKYKMENFANKNNVDKNLPQEKGG